MRITKLASGGGAELTQRVLELFVVVLVVVVVSGRVALLRVLHRRLLLAAVVPQLEPLQAEARRHTPALSIGRRRLDPRPASAY